MKNVFCQCLKAIIVTAGLFLPAIVFANAYPAGTLVRESGQPTIFYVAADGMRYRFPNLATYQTWYRDFRRVKTVGSEELKAVPLAKDTITTHPGSTLIKFTDSAEVYAVANGAVLRLIAQEKAGKTLYGHQWRDRIVVLPKNLREDYTVGAPILEAGNFDRNRTVIASKTIDQELQYRNPDPAVSAVGAATVAKGEAADPAPEKSYEPTLTALNTSLQSPLRPYFHPDIHYYWQTADNNEATVQIFLATEDPRARAFVAGTGISGNSSAPIPLGFGVNQIPVRVLTRHGTERAYLLIITRKRADNNALLQSLAENLDADLQPAFHPSQRAYTLRPAFDEPRVMLYPVADSGSAVIHINGKPVASGAGFSVPIERTPSKVLIQVRAQSGTERIYEIALSPSLVPSEATYLRSLALDLEDPIGPEFSPTKTRYYARAKANEERVIVTARPGHRSAQVVIDSEATESKSVRLFTGRNEIQIKVMVHSGLPVQAGQETVYILTIDRAIQ